jgi:hypothetical protein
MTGSLDTHSDHRMLRDLHIFELPVAQPQQRLRSIVLLAGC